MDPNAQIPQQPQQPASLPTNLPPEQQPVQVVANPAQPQPTVTPLVTAVTPTPLTESAQTDPGKLLGILSIVLCWLSWPATILGIVGLLKSKKAGHKGTLSIIGIILSILFLVLGVVLLIGDVHKVVKVTTSNTNAATSNNGQPASFANGVFSTQCYSFPTPNSTQSNTGDFTGNTYLSTDFKLATSSYPKCFVQIAPSSTGANSADQADITVTYGHSSDATITGIEALITKTLQQAGNNVDQPVYFTTSKGYSAVRLRYQSGDDDIQTFYAIADSHAHLTVGGELVNYYAVIGYTGGDKTTTPGRVDALHQVANTLTIK